MKDGFKGIVLMLGLLIIIVGSLYIGYSLIKANENIGILIVLIVIVCFYAMVKTKE